MRDVFSGRILGVGTTTGWRLVVGNWDASPFGAFSDVMVARPDGHRLLLAPSQRVADYVGSTYSFDELVVTDVDVTRPPGGGLTVVAGPLRLEVELGGRTRIGTLLRLVPGPLARSTVFARLCDPFARVLMPGVRTHGSAGQGRYEWYAARDVRVVSTLAAAWEGAGLGDLAPVRDPGFGFSSTPSTPALTEVTTTVERPD